MALIDVFTYNGERDVLRLRLSMLYKHVDEFIICEARTTFSGNSKPLYFLDQEYLFRPWERKITYHILNENNDALWQLAASSPNTKGANHWKREFVQKESMKEALTHLSGLDVVYLGDVDEMWDKDYALLKPLEKLKLRVYAYCLDNRSSEEFNGTLAGLWCEMKDKTLNHLRSDKALYGETYAGWHFTSMGGFKEVRRKLNDSYTTESYNTYEVQQHLSRRLNQGEDYLGRPFTFTINDSDWPQYLKDNREKFAHLCKAIKSYPPTPLKRYKKRGKYNTNNYELPRI